MLLVSMEIELCGCRISLSLDGYNKDVEPVSPEGGLSDRLVFDQDRLR